VLSAQRFGVVVDELRYLLAGTYGQTPHPIDPAVARALELVDGATPAPEALKALEEVRDEADGLASSEEELLLLALFEDRAEPLLRAIRERGRGSSESLQASGLDARRAERIRDLIAIVQETGIGEVTIEEGETKVTVRQTEERLDLPMAPTPSPAEPVAADGDAASPPADFIRVESPMVGTFYRASEPGAAPFVEVGDPVGPGQTLCILEAMKLMNEVKAEGEAVVRRICVENAAAVEYGQLLFELEPVNGRPFDAL
jgi:oxaloacetate decarboxylase alpha subunit